jgi:hypothetical protein
MAVVIFFVTGVDGTAKARYMQAVPMTYRAVTSE